MTNDGFRAKREYVTPHHATRPSSQSSLELTNHPREALGREDFNNKYATVWEKRSLQTGVDRVQPHLNAAADARRCADSLKDRSERHAEYMSLFGAQDITPFSSWEARTSPRRPSFYES